MLFIDDDQAGVGELNFFFQERMCPDHQLCAALRDVAADLSFAIVLQ